MFAWRAVISAMSWANDRSVEAELVALRVGHDEVTGTQWGSGFVATESGGAVCGESFRLCLQGRHPLVTREPGSGPHIEVYAILHLLGLGQPRFGKNRWVC